MNTSDAIREQTLRACIEACQHNARMCAAAADAEGPHSELLLEAARRSEAIATQLAAGRAPDAVELMRTADVCSRCAQVCEGIDELARCADACRSCAQLCLTLGQSGDDDGKDEGGRSKPPQARRGALLQQLRPDAALAAIVGAEPQTRADVTRKIWAYIKEHQLQDPHDRRRIHADERLTAVFDGNSRITMFEMSRCLNRHLT